MCNNFELYSCLCCYYYVATYRWHELFYWCMFYESIKRKYETISSDYSKLWIFAIKVGLLLLVINPYY